MTATENPAVQRGGRPEKSWTRRCPQRILGPSPHQKVEGNLYKIPRQQEVTEVDERRSQREKLSAEIEQAFAHKDHVGQWNRSFWRSAKSQY